MINRIKPPEKLEVAVNEVVGDMAIKAVDAFVSRMHDENPEKDYEIPPFYDPGKSIVAFIAKVGGDVVGLLSGVDNTPRFDADVFLVAPTYRKSNVSQELMKAAQHSRFDEILAVASPVEVSATELKSHAPAITSLKRKYEAYGFVASPAGPSTVMIWKRKP